LEEISNSSYSQDLTEPSSPSKVQTFVTLLRGQEGGEVRFESYTSALFIKFISHEKVV
jgi:hypothetical protein